MKHSPTTTDTAEDTDTNSKPGRPQMRLWIAGYAILLAGLLMVWKFSFLDHSTELVDLWKITDGSRTGFSVFVGSLVLMTGGWLWSIRLVRHRTFRELWLPVTGITLLIYLAFLFVYPATAIDVYIYAARSHLFSDYGLNPSTVMPRDFWETDAYVQYASWEWSDNVSPYGPLWNIIASPFTALDSNNIQTAVLLFKALMAASSIALAAFIYGIARIVQPAYALSATIAWLWSPIVLWEGIANSHNDVLLMLLVAAALWCWYTGHFGWIIPLLGAAALLKIVTVMLFPAAIIAILIRVGWNRRLLVTAAQTAALSILVLWVAFAPFFDIRATIDAIQSQRGIWVTSPALLVDSLIGEWGWDIDFGPIYQRFSNSVIAALTALGALAAWRRPDWLPRIAYEQLFWFLLLATSNMRPWYVIWLVALGVILPMGWPFIRAAAWSVGALFSYGYSNWIQNWGDPSWIERTATNLAITLLPVLLVMLWGLWRSGQERWSNRTAGIPSAASESPARQ